MPFSRSFDRAAPHYSHSDRAERAEESHQLTRALHPIVGESFNVRPSALDAIPCADFGAGRPHWSRIRLAGPAPVRAEQIPRCLPQKIEGAREAVDRERRAHFWPCSSTGSMTSLFRAADSPLYFEIDSSEPQNGPSATLGSILELELTTVESGDQVCNVETNTMSAS